jgi:hypothetical protein
MLLTSKQKHPVAWLGEYLSNAEPSFSSYSFNFKVHVKPMFKGTCDITLESKLVFTFLCYIMMRIVAAKENYPDKYLPRIKFPHHF